MAAQAAYTCPKGVLRHVTSIATRTWAYMGALNFGWEWAIRWVLLGHIHFTNAGMAEINSAHAPSTGARTRATKAYSKNIPPQRTGDMKYEECSGWRAGVADGAAAERLHTESLAGLQQAPIVSFSFTTPPYLPRVAGTLANGGDSTLQGGHSAAATRTTEVSKLPICDFFKRLLLGSLRKPLEEHTFYLTLETFNSLYSIVAPRVNAGSLFLLSKQRWYEGTEMVPKIWCQIKVCGA